MVRLAAVPAALHEQRLATSGAAELLGAALALHRRGGMTVHHGHLAAARAAHVHEVRVWALHKTTALVLHALRAHGGVAEVSIEEAHGDETRKPTISDVVFPILCF